MAYELLQQLLQPSATLFSAIFAVISVRHTLLHNAKALEKERERETDSIITAARSDIRAIVTALDEMGIVKQFYSVLEAKVSAETVEHLPWVAAPGKEDYFQLFDAIAPQIGRLPIDLAKEIVRFYTFLKVSRDAAQSFGTLRQQQDNNERRKERETCAYNVLIALQHVLSAAEKVLDSKHSKSKQIAENPDIDKSGALLALMKPAIDKHKGTEKETS